MRGVIQIAEIGSIEIAGSIDETGIVAGLDRITDQLKEMENQFNQVNPPMARTAGFASKLGTALIAIGTTGVAAMTALATKSPVLATTFAKMEVNMFKLSNTLGRQLKPAFEGVNNLLINVNEALLDHDSTISTVATSVGGAFEDIGSIISGQWTEISNIIPKTAGVIAGIKLGAPFGLAGMLMGAALGYVAGDIAGEAITPDVTPAEQETWGVMAESVASVREAQEPLTGGRGGEMGTQFFQFAGRGGKILYHWFVDTIQLIMQDYDVKNQAMATSDGVTR